LRDKFEFTFYLLVHV